MDNKTNYINTEKIAFRLRIERERLKITREKFAELVDLSPLYIGQLERGERQMSLNVLSNISSTLHVTTDYLLYGESDKNITNLFKENLKDYDINNDTTRKTYNKSLINLLGRCTSKQLELIENIIRLIIPYLK